MAKNKKNKCCYVRGAWGYLFAGETRNGSTWVDGSDGALLMTEREAERVAKRFDGEVLR